MLADLLCCTQLVAFWALVEDIVSVVVVVVVVVVVAAAAAAAVAERPF